jgi:hypothetical protein
MQTAISQPILQVSNTLSQHYKSPQKRQYLSCLSENSNNEKLCFKKHQVPQLHLIPQSDIFNTGGPHCLSCNYIKRVSALPIPRDSKVGPDHLLMKKPKENTAVIFMIVNLKISNRLSL